MSFRAALYVILSASDAYPTSEMWDAAPARGCEATERIFIPARKILRFAQNDRE